MTTFDGVMNALGGIGVFGLPLVALTPGLLAALVLLLPLVAVGLLAGLVALAIRQRPTRARTQAGMRRRAAPSASRSAAVASSWTPAP